MIRKKIERLNDWFNGRAIQVQQLLLFGFSVSFLGLLWLSISILPFNAKVYQSGRPTHIGRASGPQFKDTITRQTQ